MIRLRKGTVTKAEPAHPGLVELLVNVEDRSEPALGYPALTGPIAVGDVVVLNTTALARRLGTGGYHLVVAVEGQEDLDPPVEGHIMKLRYTPQQAKVLAVEEPSSPHRQAFESAEDLGGMPVVWLPLHSMVGVACAGARTEGVARVVYVMTDGAALPLWFSRQIHELREAGLIDEVITAGQALGGDHEAVNLFSALLAARAVSEADVTIVADGPGKVGTHTRWGASDVSSGIALSVAAILGGHPIAAVRLNFADSSYRHYGLSPHSATVLSKVAPPSVSVALPVLEGERRVMVEKAFREAGIDERHRVVEVDGRPAVDLLLRHGLSAATMGRRLEEEPDFFHAAGAAGILAGRIAGEAAVAAPREPVVGA
ncbi:MAG: DUF3866 family protein [Thermoleophilia bacterium]|nr:DUF3866 family protein [Thermoleophilia bacterium]